MQDEERKRGEGVFPQLGPERLERLTHGQRRRRGSDGGGERGEGKEGVGRFSQDCHERGRKSQV
jgi:hypothetical protein